MRNKIEKTRKKVHLSPLLVEVLHHKKYHSVLIRQEKWLNVDSFIITLVRLY